MSRSPSFAAPHVSDYIAPTGGGPLSPSPPLRSTPFPLIRVAPLKRRANQTDQAVLLVSTRRTW